jgi:tetratricopeptide (TPR) repeat protein
MSGRLQAERHFRKAERLAWTEQEEAEGMQEYRKALELWPDMVEAHWRIGQLHFFAEQPRLKDALAEFKEAVRLSPEWAEGRLWVANALVQLGMLTEAAEEYRRALHFAPDDPRTHFSLADCLCRMGRYGEAIRECRQGISLKPAYGELDAHMLLADALKASGQMGEALREWSIVSGMEPDTGYDHAAEAKRMLQTYSPNK